MTNFGDLLRDIGMGSFDERRRVIDEALANAAIDVADHGRLLMLLLQRHGRTEEAIAVGRRLTATDPSALDSQIALVDLLYSAGHWEEAMQVASACLANALSKNNTAFAIEAAMLLRIVKTTKGAATDHDDLGIVPDGYSMPAGGQWWGLRSGKVVAVNPPWRDQSA